MNQKQSIYVLCGILVIVLFGFYIMSQDFNRITEKTDRFSQRASDVMDKALDEHKERLKEASNEREIDKSTNELSKRLEKISDDTTRRFDKSHEDLNKVDAKWDIIFFMFLVGAVCLFIACKLNVFEKFKTRTDELETTVNGSCKNKTPMKICENCRRTIGKLEKTYIFKNSTVCSECYPRLKSQEQTV